jgi:beta-N-acetylhexosaminidase
MNEIGANVNCAPVCDLLVPGLPSHFDDRSFGSDLPVVQAFAASWVKQAARDGIISVLKHCPGLGSANEDSHDTLPTVTRTAEELHNNEIAVFRGVVSDLKASGISEDAFWIMTAHALYPALDPDRCATHSSIILSLIRNEIGFHGKIITDCLKMHALQGELWERGIAAIEAGCDYLLYVVSDLAIKRGIAEKLVEHLRKKAEEAHDAL